MKLFSKFALVGGILALALAGGCSDDDDNPNPTPDPSQGLIKVGSAATDVAGMVVNVFAKDSLFTRYTPLFIEVRDEASDVILSTATVTIHPMMDMGTMHHAAPAENPTSTTAEDGKFPCHVVFTMPGDMGWTLDITVYDPAGDREGMASVPVKVGALSPARVLNRTTLDGSDPLVVSFVSPLQPKVGQNDFEVVIHRKASMMDFPPAEDLSLTIDPQMPSMGHGSPNNVNPTHVGDGHYVGTANFTMTGTWAVGIDIYDGTTAVDTTASFEISF